MDPRESAPSRSLLHVLASALKTRLELAVSELEEEREWQKQILLLAALFIYFLTFGLLLFTLFVLVIVGGTYWVYALGGSALFYLMLALISGLLLRRKGRLSPKLFSVTLSELGKDIDLLKPKL